MQINTISRQEIVNRLLEELNKGNSLSKELKLLLKELTK